MTGEVNCERLFWSDKEKWNEFEPFDGLPHCDLHFYMDTLLFHQDFAHFCQICDKIITDCPSSCTKCSYHTKRKERTSRARARVQHLGSPLGYVYTGPDRNRFEPNRTGSASFYTGPFWKRSGTDPNGSQIGPAVM